MDLVPTFDVRPEVKKAVAAGKPVVALESTLIANNQAMMRFAGGLSQCPTC